MKMRVDPNSAVNFEVGQFIVPDPEDPRIAGNADFRYYGGYGRRWFKPWTWFRGESMIVNIDRVAGVITVEHLSWWESFRSRLPWT